MGLDMYLYKQISCWNIDKSNNKFKDGTKLELNSDDIILRQVMYWRKMYDIHQWFIDRANGCEGCEYEFPGEVILDLVEYCKERLQTTEDEWDRDWYKNTIDNLLDINEDDWFVYQSSW